LRLTGPDTVRFLQGTVSADIERLDSGRAEPAALLTVKGKLVAEMIVLAVDDETVELLVPLDAVDTVAEQLERHIIMDDVEVQKRGPISTALVFSDDGSVPQVQAPGVRSLSSRHPAPGCLVVGDDASVAAAVASFEGASEADFDAYRVQTGSPAWGHELLADYFPPEVGFTYAVSYDKGCFMGQEPLARIHARGQVNRVMVRVGSDRAPDGPADLATEERSHVGRWTTVAQRDGHVEGLAVIRRKLAVPDTLLRTVGDDPIEVRVVSEAIGDDPGVVGRSRPARA
jgi:folate-binding protein YgfZ